jgi:hypothetical protein
MKTDDEDADGRKEAQKGAKKGLGNRGLQGAVVRCSKGVRRSSEMEDRSFRTYSAYQTYLADAPDFPPEANQPHAPRSSRHGHKPPHPRADTPPHSLTASQPHSLTASQPHSLTASQPHTAFRIPHSAFVIPPPPDPPLMPESTMFSHFPLPIHFP